MALGLVKVGRFAEEFDGDKAADHAYGKGQGDDSGNDPVLDLTEVEEDCQRDAGDGNRQQGGAAAADEAKDASVKEDEGPEDEAMGHGDGDEVGDGSALGDEERAGNAQKKADGDGVDSAQVRVAPLHAEEDGCECCRQHEIAGNKGTIVQPGENVHACPTFLAMLAR
jgi:hypothetical protein